MKQHYNYVTKNKDNVLIFILQKAVEIFFEEGLLGDSGNPKEP